MFMALCFSKSSAQTVISGEPIDQSAVLDVQDTAKGVLLSAMTSVQRNAIVNPADGLLIIKLLEIASSTTKALLKALLG
jgi:hypothetical protein